LAFYCQARAGNNYFSCPLCQNLIIISRFYLFSAIQLMKLEKIFTTLSIESNTY
jgi:hypothetical protein